MGFAAPIAEVAARETAIRQRDLARSIEGQGSRLVPHLRLPITEASLGDAAPKQGVGALRIERERGALVGEFAFEIAEHTARQATIGQRFDVFRIDRERRVVVRPGGGPIGQLLPCEGPIDEGNQVLWTLASAALSSATSPGQSAR